MTTLKLLLANLALINACTDSYPQPDSVWDWCDSIPGVSDGQNCWGGCATGCPSCSSPGCSIETRGPRTSDSCFPGLSAPLCCAHVTGGGNATLTQKNNTMIMAKQVTVSVKNVGITKPDACVDGGAACTSIGGTCCYSPDSTHDCCCAAGSHCAVFSGTSCGAICAPGIMETHTSVAAPKKVENVPCSPTTYCPDGDICCNACNGCCPSGTTCDCAAGTCDSAEGAKVSMKAFVKLMATTVETAMP